MIAGFVFCNILPFQKNFHWPFCHCKSIKFLSSVTFRLWKSSGTRRFVEEKFKTCDLISLHTNLYLKCFSQMQISNIHKSIIAMKSIDMLFQENCSTCFIGCKTTWLPLVVLNPIKHSCSVFKHYLNPTFHFLPNHSIAEKNVITCWPYSQIHFWQTKFRTLAPPHQSISVCRVLHWGKIEPIK